MNVRIAWSILGPVGSYLGDANNVLATTHGMLAKYNEAENL